MDNVKSIWKPELYKIQMEAPKPKKIVCNCCPSKPEFYGKEYHGFMSHKQATVLLETEPNGAYLVRKGNKYSDFYTLSWKLNDKIHHYKLYYDGMHYIKEKRYANIDDLVADGLVICYMDLKGKHILELINSQTDFTNSPYMTLNRSKLNNLSQKQNLKKSNSTIDIINNKLNTIATGKQNIFSDTFSVLSSNQKSHVFKVHTFKGLNWCELCANFLWGFTAQGVKCEDCGLIAHIKCGKCAPSHCVPDMKKLRGVFGLDLTSVVKCFSSTLPFVVRRCIDEIEKRGMDSEGIYRVSGFADEIDSLKSAIDKDGESTDLSTYSINVIAGTLKLYLRLLPVPLITFDVHSKFIEAIQCAHIVEQIVKLRDCLDILPPAHYNCLRYVVEHLHKVAQRCDVNKMSAHNLSTVLAPTLVATPPCLTDLSLEIRALQALIEHAPMVYYGRPELK